MTDFIEKKVEAFDEKFAPALMPAEYHAYGMNGASHPVIENAKDFLRTALEEALLKGRHDAHEELVEQAKANKEVMEGTE